MEGRDSAGMSEKNDIHFFSHDSSHNSALYSHDIAHPNSSWIIIQSLMKNGNAPQVLLLSPRLHHQESKPQQQCVGTDPGGRGKRLGKLGEKCNFLRLTLSVHPWHQMTVSKQMPISLSVCLSVYLSAYLSINLSINLSICLAIYLSIYLSSHLSICLSIHPSIHLYIYLSFFLSIWVMVCRARVCVYTLPSCRGLWVLLPSQSQRRPWKLGRDCDNYGTL